MNLEMLVADLEPEPFIPLRIHLKDGGHVDISNPRVCVFLRQLSPYVFSLKHRSVLAEDVQVISLRAIVSVETLPPSQAA
jgi:hypothetical protein